MDLREISETDLSQIDARVVWTAAGVLMFLTGFLGTNLIIQAFLNAMR